MIPSVLSNAPSYVLIPSGLEKHNLVVVHQGYIMLPKYDFSCMFVFVLPQLTSLQKQQIQTQSLRKSPQKVTSQTVSL